MTMAELINSNFFVVPSVRFWRLWIHMCVCGFVWSRFQRRLRYLPWFFRSTWTPMLLLGRWLSRLPPRVCGRSSQPSLLGPAAQASGTVPLEGVAALRCPPTTPSRQGEPLAVRGPCASPSCLLIAPAAAAVPALASPRRSHVGVHGDRLLPSFVEAVLGGFPVWLCKLLYFEEIYGGSETAQRPMSLASEEA